MSNTDLFNFKLTVSKARTERDLVFLLLHAETIAADLRQTPCEKERSFQAVWYVRMALHGWQATKSLRSLQLPIPHGLRDAAA